ncbi:stabilization of polarity axis-domain-containing protein [Catenaria anguillulae PL171]|uniref:Stabilization of polarity axis-domain-containing protein n=1 Tax=Catenaria anguillulae PL171 TaxID=765915 RepID=A0A1Y2HM86_9FUNG|nr:stabilization of polarity axis-domain-containing protein [Catenaria anguillulae PL171]
MLPATPIKRPAAMPQASAALARPPMRHVEYIFAAVFDEDRGSLLSHEYPTESGTKKETLAELMLPEGAHLRSSDWTVFFLNQRQDQDRSESDQRLLFVLNHVSTKMDPTTKRGARMMAMAVASKHHFVHVFKPALVLAITDFLENPNQTILANLFASINAMDLSAMPTLTRAERLILRNADNGSSSLLLERLAIHPPEQQHQQQHQPAGDIRRISMAPALSTTGAPNPLSSTQSAKTNKDPNFHETSIKYGNTILSLRIPMTFISLTEEVTDFSMIKLFTKFAAHPPFPAPHHPALHPHGASTPAILVLLNAILTHHRVLFVAHNLPAGEIANYVLAACALASGCGAVLRGFTERAFPYTCLANVDQLLACPGYIAGVTNPFFQEKTQWWDVCADVVNGRIRVSPNIKFDEPIARPSRSFLPSFLSSSSDSKRRSTYQSANSLSLASGPPPVTGVVSTSLGSISTTTTTVQPGAGAAPHTRFASTGSMSTSMSTMNSVTTTDSANGVDGGMVSPHPGLVRAASAPISDSLSSFTQPGSADGGSIADGTAPPRGSSLSNSQESPLQQDASEGIQSPATVVSSLKDPSFADDLRHIIYETGTSTVSPQKSRRRSVGSSEGMLSKLISATSVAPSAPLPPVPALPSGTDAGVKYPSHDNLIRTRSRSASQSRIGQKPPAISIGGLPFSRRSSRDDTSTAGGHSRSASSTPTHATPTSQFPFLHTTILSPPAGSSAASNGSGSASTSATSTTPMSPRKSSDKENYDFYFVDAVSAAIAAHFSESYIRMLAQQYVHRFVRVAAYHEVMSLGQSPLMPSLGNVPYVGPVWTSVEARAKDLIAHVPVIDAWRSRSPSYAMYLADVHGGAGAGASASDVPGAGIGGLAVGHAAAGAGALVNGVDVAHWIDRLLLMTGMSTAEVEQMYDLLLSKIEAKDHITQLLSYLPLSHGGLMPLAAPGLFHPVETVRRKARRLLHRIHRHPIGEAYIQALNPFVRTQYLRGIKGDRRPPVVAQSTLISAED